ncbi:phytol kinase 1, chloroplastic-like isoform X2 [Pistacia vera]|uniref:phytol kinase 1, chloroplastic-like isoform X2 n=1 Tax=Pistacia vera TaxID=55513 RepID=UPI001263E618|nr:phytol kinase 1, chloroplastic-like isoform X2 [Pistacia vera]
MHNHHLSLNMSLSSSTHLPSFPNPIILRHHHHRRHQLHAPATNRPSLSLSPTASTFPRSDFLLLYPHRSYWARPTCGAAAGIGDLLHDAGATAIVLAGAYGLVLGFDTLTQRNVVQQSLSRKLVHILSGLLFMHSTSTGARYFASLVPLVNCFRLLVHGLSLVRNEGLIKSVTREGNPEELLKGPLYYVLMLILCAVLFWRDSPVGVISVSMMCAGDGVADIMGRKFGSAKIFYNKKKSWAGSISMFVFGFFASVGMLYYYSVLGYFQLDWESTMQRVALVSLVATIIESLPITDVLDDNISVPLASMAAAYLSFG